MYLRMIARKKIGIEIPIREPTKLAWSNGAPVAVSRRRSRAGCPGADAKIIAANASSTVAGKRSLISVVTGRREAMLMPRSPEAVVFT